MAMAVLKCIILLSCWSFTGVAATDTLTTHYQLKNSSLCLHVKKQSEYKYGQWTFNDTLLAGNDLINPNYKERVYFSSKNMTLCIYRLSENDTGIFKASYFINFVNILEKHQIIVQDMVPTPLITARAENNSNVSAAGLCNFTVNCSIQNDWLLSICDEDRCRASQWSFGQFNITVFTENTDLVCSGNNHVSMNNISKGFSALCVVKSNLELEEELHSPPNIYEIVIVIIFFVFFICGCVAITIKFFRAKHNQETTSAAQLIQSGPLDTAPPSEPRVSTSSSEAEPSYENVETSQPRQNSIQINEQVFSESQMVDTVYSVPTKADSGVKSDNRKDPLGDGNQQETAGSVSVNEEQRLTQTETVYSVLQMPKNLNSSHHQEDK